MGLMDFITDKLEEFAADGVGQYQVSYLLNPGEDPVSLGGVLTIDEPSVIFDVEVEGLSQWSGTVAVTAAALSADFGGLAQAEITDGDDVDTHALVAAYTLTSATTTTGGTFSLGLDEVSLSIAEDVVTATATGLTLTYSPTTGFTSSGYAFPTINANLATGPPGGGSSVIDASGSGLILITEDGVAAEVTLSLTTGPTFASQSFSLSGDLLLRLNTTGAPVAEISGTPVDLPSPGGATYIQVVVSDASLTIGSGSGTAVLTADELIFEKSGSTVTLAGTGLAFELQAGSTQVVKAVSEAVVMQFVDAGFVASVSGASVQGPQFAGDQFTLSGKVDFAVNTTGTAAILPGVADPVPGNLDSVYVKAVVRGLVDGEAATLTIGDSTVSATELVFERNAEGVAFSGLDLSFELMAGAKRIIGLSEADFAFQFVDQGFYGALLNAAIQGPDFTDGDGAALFAVAGTIALRVNTTTQERNIMVDGQNLVLPGGTVSSPYIRLEVTGPPPGGVDNPATLTIAGNTLTAAKLVFEQSEGEILVSGETVGFQLTAGDKRILSITDASFAFVFNEDGFVGALRDAQVQGPEFDGFELSGTVDLDINTTGANALLDGFGEITGVAGGVYIKASVSNAALIVQGAVSLQAAQLDFEWSETGVALGGTDVTFRLEAGGKRIIELSNAGFAFNFTDAGFYGAMQGGTIQGPDFPDFTLQGTVTFLVNTTTSAQSVTVGGGDPINLSEATVDTPYLRVEVGQVAPDDPAALGIGDNKLTADKLIFELDGSNVTLLGEGLSFQLQAGGKRVLSVAVESFYFQFSEIGLIGAVVNAAVTGPDIAGFNLQGTVTLLINTSGLDPPVQLPIDINGDGEVNALDVVPGNADGIYVMARVTNAVLSIQDSVSISADILEFEYGADGVSVGGANVSFRLQAGTTRLIELTGVDFAFEFVEDGFYGALRNGTLLGPDIPNFTLQGVVSFYINTTTDAQEVTIPGEGTPIGLSAGTVDSPYIRVEVLGLGVGTPAEIGIGGSRLGADRFFFELDGSEVTLAGENLFFELRAGDTRIVGLSNATFFFAFREEGFYGSMRDAIIEGPEFGGFTLTGKVSFDINTTGSAQVVDLGVGYDPINLSDGGGSSFVRVEVAKINDLTPATLALGTTFSLEVDKFVFEQDGDSVAVQVENLVFKIGTTFTLTGSLDLVYSPEEFRINNAVLSVNEIAIGDVIRIGTPTISLQDFVVTSAGEVSGIVTISASEVFIFEGNPSFSVSVQDSDSDGFALVGGFNLGTGAFTLNLDHFTLTFGDVFIAEATGVTIGYDPEIVGRQLLVTIDDGTISFPLLGGLNGSVSDLEIWTDGFSVGELVVNQPGLLSIGPVLDLTNLTVRFQDFALFFGETTTTIEGSISVEVDSAAFLPGKPLSGSLVGTTITFNFEDGAFTGLVFSADTLTFSIGSFLSFEGENVTINTAATGDEFVVTFGTIGGTLTAGTFSVSASGSNFGITADGDFRVLPGEEFSVALSLDGVDGNSLKWPSWLPIAIDSLELTWEDLEGDPLDFQIKLDARVTGFFGIGGLEFGGSVKGLVIDLGLLAEGKFPVTQLAELGVSIKGNLFGGEIEAALIAGIVKIDTNTGFELPADAEGANVDSVFFVGFIGGLKLAGLGGLNVRVAFSERGPLAFYLEAAVPILLDPNTGLTLDRLRGGVEFSKTIPEPADAFALRSPDFAPPGELTLEQWRDRLVEQIGTQVLDDVTFGDPASIFLSPMVISAGADLYSTYSSKFTFRAEVDVSIDTTGKILINASAVFGDTLNAKTYIYGDLTQIQNGAGRFIFLVDLPEQVGPLPPLLSIYGEIKFEFVQELTGGSEPLTSAQLQSLNLTDVRTDTFTLAEGGTDPTFTLGDEVSDRTGTVSLTIDDVDFAGTITLGDDNRAVTVTGTFAADAVFKFSYKVDAAVVTDTFTAGGGETLQQLELTQVPVLTDAPADAADVAALIGLEVNLSGTGLLVYGVDYTLNLSNWTVVLSPGLAGPAQVTVSYEPFRAYPKTGPPEETTTTFRITIAGGAQFSLPGDLNATASGEIILSFNSERFRLQFSASMDISFVGQVGAAAGEFVVEQVDGEYQVWGAVQINTGEGLSAFLEPKGITLEGTARLSINTSDQLQTVDLRFPIEGATAPYTPDELEVISIDIKKQSFSIFIDTTASFTPPGGGDRLFGVTGQFFLEITPERLEVFANGTLELGAADAPLAIFNATALFVVNESGAGGRFTLFIASSGIPGVEFAAAFHLAFNTTGERIEFLIPELPSPVPDIIGPAMPFDSGDPTATALYETTVSTPDGDARAIVIPAGAPPLDLSSPADWTVDPGQEGFYVYIFGGGSISMLEGSLVMTGTFRLEISSSVADGLVVDLRMNMSVTLASIGNATVNGMLRVSDAGLLGSLGLAVAGETTAMGGFEMTGVFFLEINTTDADDLVERAVVNENGVPTGGVQNVSIDANSFRVFVGASVKLGDFAQGSGSVLILVDLESGDGLVQLDLSLNLKAGDANLLNFQASGLLVVRDTGFAGRLTLALSTQAIPGVDLSGQFHLVVNTIGTRIEVDVPDMFPVFMGPNPADPTGALISYEVSGGEGQRQIVIPEGAPPAGSGNLADWTPAGAGGYFVVLGGGNISVLDAFDLEGWFLISVSSTEISIDFEATTELSTGGTTLLTFDVNGGLLINQHGAAGVLALDVDAGLPGDTGFTLTATFQLELNTMGMDPGRTFTGYVFNADGTVVAGQTITLESGSYVRVAAGGTFGIGGLSIGGRFEFTIATGKVAMAFDAQMDLKAGASTLFGFNVGGDLEISSAGVAGILNLSLRVGGNQAASFGFTLNATFQLEINTTGGTLGRTFSGYVFNQDGTVSALQQITLQSGNYVRVAVGGSFGLEGFTINGRIEFTVAPGLLELEFNARMNVAVSSQDLFGFTVAGGLHVSTAGIAGILQLNLTANGASNFGFSLSANFQLAVNTTSGTPSFAGFQINPTTGQITYTTIALLPGNYVRIEVGGTLTVGGFEIKGRFLFEYSSTTLLIDMAASLQLGPLGSVAISGGVLINQDGLVSRISVAMNLGNSTVGLTLSGFITVAINTTGSSAYFPDNSSTDNLVAPGVLVSLGATFDFLGFASGTGTATIQIGSNPVFRLDAEITFNIGPLEFDASALLEIYNNGIYFNASVNFNMSIEVMSLSLGGTLTIDTRGSGFFRLNVNGDLSVLSVINVTGSVIVQVSGYQWSVTIPSPGLTADLFGLLSLKLHGYFNSKGHFDLTLTGNITLGDSSTGVSGTATIRVAMNPETKVDGVHDFLATVGGSFSAKFAGVTLFDISANANAKGNLGQSVTVNLDVEAKGTFIETVMEIVRMTRDAAESAGYAIVNFLGNLGCTIAGWFGACDEWVEVEKPVNKNVTKGISFSLTVGTFALPGELIAAPPPPPLLAGQANGSIWGEFTTGVLHLNVGDRSSNRNASPGEIHESYTITRLGAGSFAGTDRLLVSAFGRTEIFDNVTSIVGHFGNGNDTLFVNAGVTVDFTGSGGSGNDTLSYNGSGAAIMSAGSGNDSLVIGSAATGGSLTGNSGTNTLINDSHADVAITGGTGNDLIIAGFGTNTSLSGGAGDDLIEARGTLNIATGGTGNDIFRLNAANFGPGNIFNAGGGTFDRLEIVGTEGADDFRVTRESSGKIRLTRYVGGVAAGHVIAESIEELNIDGRGGSNVVTINGAGGFDQLKTILVDLGTSGSQPGRVELMLGAGNDTVNMSTSGAAGAKTFAATWIGNFTTYIESASVAAGDVFKVHGLAGNDVLNAAAVDESPFAELWLMGGSGDDTLIGSPGSDHLDGGSGNNRFTGGAGQDFFYAEAGTGFNTLFELDYSVGGGLDFGIYGNKFVAGNATVTGTGEATAVTSFTSAIVEDITGIFDLIEVLGGDGSNVFAIGSAGGTVTLNGVSTAVTARTGEVYVNGLLGDDVYVVELNGLDGATVEAMDETLGEGPFARLAGGNDRMVFKGTNAAEVGYASANAGVMEFGLQADVSGATASLVRTIGVESDEIFLRGGNDNFTIHNVVGTNLLVDGGSGNDRFDIRAISAPTTINAGSGNDEIFVGSQAGLGDTDGTLNAILANLTVNGQAGSDVLHLDDTGDAAANTGTLTNSTLTGLGLGGTLSYSGLTTLNLGLGSGHDSFNVRSTLAGAVTNLNTGPGNDTVRVGSLAPASGGTISGIEGRLNVDGGTGTNQLLVYNSGDAADRSGTLTASTLRGLGMGAQGIDYFNFNALELDLGSGSDTLLVESTHAGTTLIDGGAGNDTFNVRTIAGVTTVNAGSGNDTFNVGSLAPGTGGTVNGIGAHLVINGNAGTDTLNVDDAGETTSTTGVLTATTLNGLGLSPSGITYSDLTDLNITLGSASDVFTIASTHAGTTYLNAAGGNDTINVQSIAGVTTIHGGAGNDTFNVGSLAPATGGNLNSIGAHLVIDGIAGANVLNLDDTSDNFANSGVLTATTLTGLGLSPAGLTYATIATLNLDLGSGGDTFRIDSTHAGTTNLDTGAGHDAISIRTISGPTNIQTGAGDDIVRVGSLAPSTGGTVNAITGLLVIDGGSGVNELHVDDTGDSADNTGVLTNATLRGLGMSEGIDYANFNHLTIGLGSGHDTFTIESTHAGTTVLDAGPGHDTVDIVSIAGETWINGNAGNDVITVNPAHVQGTNPIGAVLHLNGGDGGDQYFINLTGAGASLVNVYDTGAAGVDFLEVNGTAGNDTFLLRKGFLALLQYGAEGEQLLTFERINYDANINGMLTINAVGGSNHFAIDDNSAETTINGADEGDTFQIGQIFGEDFVGAGFEPGDLLATTRGLLSPGVSRPLTVNGGDGDNIFTVYHNRALVELNGGEGNDTFFIRAFALAGSAEGEEVYDAERGATNVSTGSGTNHVEYAINAPVAIDGGGGFNTVVVIGTEFADSFVITQDGVYGAGLFVEFVNIQELVVYGAEGNDNFWVLGTGAGMSVRIVGGLGSDTVHLGGQPDPVEVAVIEDGIVVGTVMQIFDPVFTLTGILGPLMIDGGLGDGIPPLEPGIGLPGEITGPLPIINNPNLYADEEDQVDRLIAHNSGSTSNDVGTLTHNRLFGLGMVGETAIGDVTFPAGVQYIELEEVIVNLGSGHDTFTIESTHAGRTVIDGGDGNDTINIRTISGHTTIQGGAGDDTFNVGTLAPGIGGTVNELTALLTIDGGAGSDTVNVDDRGDTADNTGILTQTTLTGLDMVSDLNAVNDLLSLTVFATGGTFTLGYEGAEVTVDWNATHHDLTAALWQLLGNRNAMALQFGDAYLINFQGALKGQTVSLDIDASGLTHDSGDASIEAFRRIDGVNYYDVTTLNIDLGSGDDVFNVQGTTAVTNLSTHDGDDRIYVSSDADLDNGTFTDFLTGHLDNLTGTLNLHAGTGRNLLMVSDEAATIGDGTLADPVLITHDLISGLAPADITYQADATGGDFTPGITLWAGSGDDVIRVTGTDTRPGVRTTTTLNTGAGDDQVTVELDAALHGFFVLNTQDGDDTVDASASTLPLVIFGGEGDDTITGGNGGDIIFGDLGRVHYVDADGLVVAALGGGGPGDFTDGVIRNAAAIFSVDPLAGGNDVIVTHDGNDILIGGSGNDWIETSGGNNLIFGDHGRIEGVILPHLLPLAMPVADKPFTFTSIYTGLDDGGGSDVIFGGSGQDIIIGGQGDDIIFGRDGDDDIIGGHNVAGGAAGNNIIDGGAGNNVILGDNGSIERRGDTLSPLIRMLDGGTLYRIPGTAGFDPAYGAAVTGAWQAHPYGVAGRDIVIFDHHHDDTATWMYGDDIIAGGAGHDLIFGQLGDDILHGDGWIEVFFDALRQPLTDRPVAVVHMSTDVSGDGDDYIEGGGGDDLIIGGLGQDNLIGGSSSLFGLEEARQRPDGSDMIFGGNAVTLWRYEGRFYWQGNLPAVDPAELELVHVSSVNAIDLNHLGLQPGDPDYADRHARDADVIIGDNGNVFQIIGADDAYLSFNYDALDATRGDLRIIPRAFDLLDYVPGTGDPSADGIHCGGDILYGEDGDDIIHGMTGNDVIYGGAGDDDLYGGTGHDWISGGAGDDGILGDDGKIFTSRISSQYGEPLHGVSALPANQLNKTISSAGNHHMATINVAGSILKTVDLQPYEMGGHDIIYGGRGNDFLHGGFGDDAISGAEPLAVSAATIEWNVFIFRVDDPHGIRANLDDPLVADYGILDYGFLRDNKFPLYDAEDAMRKIMIDPATGQIQKNLTDPDAIDFLLNFDAYLKDAARLPVMDGTGGLILIHHGNDVIFGGDGNDWLVAGTGNNRLYGGLGDDLLNVNNNLDTNGGLNDQPDAPMFAFADIAYGGAGRDILIANTGADRLIDWSGEFNSYLVPFSPFGAGTITRASAPHIVSFLIELAASDGADFAEHAGEPYGELGLIVRGQTGGPDDPQPGNGRAARDTRGDYSTGTEGATTTQSTTTSESTDLVPLGTQNSDPEAPATDEGGGTDASEGTGDAPAPGPDVPLEDTGTDTGYNESGSEAPAPVDDNSPAPDSEDESGMVSPDDDDAGLLDNPPPPAPPEDDTKEKSNNGNGKDKK